MRGFGGIAPLVGDCLGGCESTSALLRNPFNARCCACITANLSVNLYGIFQTLITHLGHRALEVDPKIGIVLAHHTFGHDR